MKAFTTIFAVILAFTFTSCFHDRVSSSSGNENHKTSQHEKKQVAYTMSGQFQNLSKWLRVMGKSNLKKGTKVTIMLNDKKLGETIVKKDGSFYTDFDSKVIDQTGPLVVVMIPMEQTDQLKKVYGAKGEKLTGEFCFNSTEGGVQFTELKAGMVITKDLISGQFTEFNSIFFTPDALKDMMENMKQKDKDKSGS